MYERALSLGQLLAALISPASRRGIKGEFEDIVSYRVFYFFSFKVILSAAFEMVKGILRLGTFRAHYKPKAKCIGAYIRREFSFIGY